MNFTCSKEEYEKAKDELRMRLQLMYTQNMGVITASITVWAIAIALLASAFQYSNINELTITFEYIFLVMPGCLAIPLSAKSGDNLNRVTQLAAYIRVFYEEQSIALGQASKSDTAENVTTTTICCYEKALKIIESKQFDWKGYKRAEKSRKKELKRVGEEIGVPPWQLLLFNCEFVIMAMLSLISTIAFTICITILLIHMEMITVSLIVFISVGGAISILISIAALIIAVIFSSPTRNVLSKIDFYHNEFVNAKQEIIKELLNQ